jgi:predicted phage baseplate assembly protein
MSQPWWGKESAGTWRSGRTASAAAPQLLAGSRDAVAKALLARAEAYTAEWTNRSRADAGAALVSLFSEQMETVLARLNRLPEKALVEFLRLAGVQPLPARPAAALLEFQVSPAAPRPVLVAQGFQVGARPQGGGGALVTFETDSDLYAAPATVAEMHVLDGGLFREVTKKPDDPTPVLPFGNSPEAGQALLLGLDGNVAPGPQLALGVRVAAPPGAPPPVPLGGLMPLPVPPAPLLQWEAFTGGAFEAVRVLRDETGGLVRSGVVELRAPAAWPAGRPPGLAGKVPLRWLRLRIVNGRYAEPPSLLFIRTNMVGATAARTLRNEVLEPVPGSGGRRMRLSQTPVLPGSLVLEIDDGRTRPGGAGARWTEVDDLYAAGPDAPVYTLDPASGEVAFGDGVHGAAVPAGFRNVRAVSYRAGGGRAGAADAKGVSTLLSSAPFIAAVSNPLPASGGADPESQADAVRRGPLSVWVRDRTVTTSDYEVLARAAPGADVRRARALADHHPSYPNTSLPGVVGVYLVPADRAEGPPTPDEGTLRAVAKYLSGTAAPAGVEVVAAAPRYRKVRVRTGVVLDPAVDVGAMVKSVLEALDRYVNPLTGGDDGQGWPFGGPLRYAALVRLLVGVRGVRAAPHLTVLVDGAQVPACADYALAAYELFWPDGHEVIPVRAEGQP